MGFEGPKPSIGHECGIQNWRAAVPRRPSNLTTSPFERSNPIEVETPSKNQPIVNEWKSGDGILHISLLLKGTTRRSSCWLRFAPKTAGQFLRGRKHLTSCARRGGRLAIGRREDSSSCRITCMSFAALRSGLREDWHDGSASGKQRCRALGSGPKSSRSGSKISGIDRCGQASTTATGGSMCGKTPFAPA